MAKTIVLAIDQSYTRLGYAVVTATEVLEINSVDMSKMKNPTQKRNCVRQLVQILVRKYRPKIIVVERVRLFAGKFLSGKTAGMLAAMTAVIVDAAYIHDTYTKPTPVFSLDTRHWKKRMLDNSNATKADAVKYVHEVAKLDNNINHDSADAFCMARYCWTKNLKLQRER